MAILLIDRQTDKFIKSLTHHTDTYKYGKHRKYYVQSCRFAGKY